MKYIICEDFGGQPIPFLFPEKVAHADLREQLPYSRLVSAGYVVLKDGEFICTGGDAELELTAGPDDADCIAAAFRPGSGL